MEIDLFSNPNSSLIRSSSSPTLQWRFSFSRASYLLPHSPTGPRSCSRSPSLQFTRLRCSPVKMSTISSQGENAGAAILWFKQDLRVDDHPGLIAASRHPTVIPLYVFDHRILSHFTEEMLELVLFALKDLRNSLKDQGSDLMVRFGSAEAIIQDLVKEVKAASVYAEEEVEYTLRTMMNIVEETLAKVLLEEECPRFIPWSTPFYDIKSLKDLPASYEDFKRLNLSVTSPLLPPKLPALELDMVWGSIPTMDDLKKFMNENRGKLIDTWTSIKNIPAEEVLKKRRVAVSNNLTKGFRLPKAGESNQSDLNYALARRKRMQKSAFLTQQGNSVGGGTSAVLNALAAYLRYLEGTARDDWQEVHQKLRSAESREGASFGVLFGSVLQLGIISRRRVNYEAIKYEKERNGGFLSPFGYSTATAAAAADTVRSMEWYWLMASRLPMLDAEKMYSIRFWRWNGYLIQYAVAGHEGPAVLLVHGFGAFLEHYRDNINDIAEGRNQVWAISLLGFGRSEKPNVVYTELMWAELLKDFIIEVVKQPVHLVGNSLGGYFVAIVAGLWPALARSVVLLNSAGDFVPGYSSVPSSKERQTSGPAWLGARFLSPFLQWSLSSIVKSCYPNKTDRADDWLINEMLRASHDPGVMVVLESIFSFNLAIPLNYLLKGFEEKVLVIQGMKDPISDSNSKLAILREHWKGITTKELDAGHCPHDELPEEVNAIIRQWVVNIVSRSNAKKM